LSATDPVQLNPDAVQQRREARWSRMLATLVEENAHLEAYVSLLTERITELEAAQPTDPWGDQPEK
jgi:hypothetical protein